MADVVCLGMQEIGDGEWRYLVGVFGESDLVTRRVVIDGPYELRDAFQAGQLDDEIIAKGKEL